jgi:hypothetical protein
MGGAGDDVQWRKIAYNPLPSQRLFHESEARFKGFSGPIGSGKSQALCQEAIKLSYLNMGRLGLIGAPTYPMLRDATQATMFEILEANKIAHEHNKAENTLTIKDTGSRILFRAVEEFERLRGTNLAWFGLDELTYTQEAAWLRLEGRLRDPKAHRLCGFAVWTPKGYDWVYQKFVAAAKKGYVTILAKPFENHHLVPDYYERLKASYDERFFAQEVMGQYLSMDGARAYSSFDRETHVQELKAEPYLPLMWALDFNVDPMSSVIVQIVGRKVKVLDEIVIRHGTTFQACEEFLKRYDGHRGGVEVYGDASGYAQQTTGETDYNMIREYFRVHSSVSVTHLAAHVNPPVRERVNTVNGRLRSAAGEIGLVVDTKCRELILDFEQVVYKTEGCQIDKDRDRMRTHLSDALGYLVWHHCKPATRIGEQPHRLPL